MMSSLAPTPDTVSRQRERGDKLEGFGAAFRSAFAVERLVERLPAHMQGLLDELGRQDALDCTAPTHGGVI